MPFMTISHPAMILGRLDRKPNGEDKDIFLSLFKDFSFGIL